MHLSPKHNLLLNIQKFIQIVLCGDSINSIDVGLMEFIRKVYKGSLVQSCICSFAFQHHQLFSLIVTMSTITLTRESHKTQQSLELNTKTIGHFGSKSWTVLPSMKTCQPLLLLQNRHYWCWIWRYGRCHQNYEQV